MLKKLFEYTIKCVIATICLSYIFHVYCPKYDFPNDKTPVRINRVTGDVEMMNCAYEWENVLDITRRNDK